MVIPTVKQYYLLSQNLDKLSTKLEDEREKAQLDLELKMKRRKQQHEKNQIMVSAIYPVYIQFLKYPLLPRLK